MASVQVEATRGADADGAIASSERKGVWMLCALSVNRGFDAMRFEKERENNR